MQAQTIDVEFQSFVQFATSRIESGVEAESVESLVQQWRDNREYDQTVADIRQALDDDAHGRSQAAAATFSDIRRQLGIVA